MNFERVSSVHMRHHGVPSDHHMMGFTNYTGFWLVIVAILLVVILVLGYLLIKNNNQRSKAHDHANDNALKILNERYANGELTEDEYVHKKEVLHKS